VNDWREEGNPQTIFAESGRISYDPCPGVPDVAALARGGDPLGGRAGESADRGFFKTYELPLQLFRFTSPGQVSEREMSLGELRQGIRTEPPGSKRHVRLVVELHQRLALPLGALLLCLLAVPLGLSPPGPWPHLGAHRGVGHLSDLLYCVHRVLAPGLQHEPEPGVGSLPGEYPVRPGGRLLLVAHPQGTAPGAPGLVLAVTVALRSPVLISVFG
jgi:hypothetical protein